MGRKVRKKGREGVDLGKTNFFPFHFIFSLCFSGIDMWDDIWGKVGAGGEVDGEGGLEESEKLRQLLSDFRAFLTEYHPYLDTNMTLERLQVFIIIIIIIHCQCGCFCN